MTEEFKIPPGYWDKEKPARIRKVKPKKFKQYPDVTLHEKAEKDWKAKGYHVKGLRFSKRDDTVKIAHNKQKMYHDPDTWNDYMISRTKFEHLTPYNTKKAVGILNKKFKRNYPPPPTPPVTQSAAKSPFYHPKPIASKKRKQGIGVGHGGIRKKQRKS